MEPIINPWIFYVINVICNLNILFVALAISLLLGIVYFVSFWLESDSCGWDDKSNKNKALATKWLKRLIVLLILDTVVFVFIPSKETMITMLVSNYVTPDNIQIVQGNIVDFTKQLVSAVAEGINQTGGK